MNKVEQIVRWKRIGKSWFLGFFSGVVMALAVVRCAYPEVAGFEDAANDAAEKADVSVARADDDSETNDAVDGRKDESGKNGRRGDETNKTVTVKKYTSFHAPDGTPLKHRILSVPGFSRTFPDMQDVHIIAARKWGVTPVEDREEAERRKDELVYVGASPYYTMDDRMSYSIPYLVPRASNLLQRIGRNFMDSLAIKQIPLHTLIVTSVLRTESDVRKLRRVNYNASSESCHRYGTTFDICYNRYHAVEREVRNDSLKWVLAEVLRDLRKADECYVKYEVKQGCFHITVR